MYKCSKCEKEFDSRFKYAAHMRHCGVSSSGKNNPHYGKKGHNQYTYGAVMSERTKKKIGAMSKGKNNHWFGKFGDKHPTWKGESGRSKIKQRVVNSNEYKNWRSKVFERDKWTCKECNIKSGNLEAHHIIPYAYITRAMITFKEIMHCDLLWDIDNGLTLCKRCHKKIHKMIYSLG